jgi:precorrin-8X/cobalt-precorrin-8 methylmutase
MAAMRKLAPQIKDAIVAIGNAPTALVEVMRLAKKGYAPAAIIGVPVGFVGAAESKEELPSMDIPFITVQGTKGGSTIACSIVNALLYLEDIR